MNGPTITSILDYIEKGYLDGDGIELIIEAAVARRRFLQQMQAAKNMRDFDHGTLVRLINIKPKYLTGVEATVDKTRTPSKSGTISVTVVDRHLRRLGRFSRHLSVPASSLERVA